MSNEAVYRQAWATFVEDTIKRQSVNGDGERFGDRVVLRDLIQLEEVLSKLTGKENPVSFSKGSSGGGTQDLPRARKPLEAISGVPTLFENPLPSFLESMYAAAAPAGDEAGRKSDSGGSCAGSMGQEGVDPKGTKYAEEHLAATVKRGFDIVRSQMGGDGGSSDARRVVSPASQTGEPAQVSADVREDGEGDRRYDLASDLALVRTRNLGDADTDENLEGREDAKASTAIRVTSSCSHVSSRELESSATELTTPTVVRVPLLGEPLSKHSNFECLGRSPQPDAHSLDGHSALEASYIADKTLVLEERVSPLTGFLAEGDAEIVPPTIDAQVLSLSERLEVTRIETETDSGANETSPRSSTSPPEEQEVLLEITVLEASRCNSDDACGTEASKGYTFSSQEIKHPSAILSNSPQTDHSRLWFVAARDESQERVQLRRDRERPREEACGDVSYVSEGQVRSESGESWEPGSGSLAASTPDDGQRTRLDGASLVNEENSAELRKRDFGADQIHTLGRTLSEGARMDDHGNPCKIIEDNDPNLVPPELEVVVSTEGGPLSSGFSQGIGGFEFEGDAPSPLAMVESLFVDDVVDGRAKNAFSPARSTVSEGSESTLEAEEAVLMISAIQTMAEEDETRVPEASRRESSSPHADRLREGTSKGAMPPPSPPQQASPVSHLALDMQLLEITPEPNEFVKEGSVLPEECAAASPDAGGVQRGNNLRRESLLRSPCESNFDEACRENASIGSFSNSEQSPSGFDSDFGRGHRAQGKEADASLVEGTPRRCGRRSKTDLAGFYAPLMRSTLDWMVWREGVEDVSETRKMHSGQPGFEKAIRGGILGHLAADEASSCLATLIRNAPRAGAEENVVVETSLPHGATLVIAPTKDAAEEWSKELGSDTRLSVLSYVMPLKERRRLRAEQAAVFDVVVTTYDILRAKEVARAVKDVANVGRWHTRRTQEGRKRVSKTENMASLLHRVWWHRVVASGAQVLANQRSARANAVAGLAGGARWCAVDREDMSTVESASERMRGLTTFIGVPSEVPLVDVADCLFYHSRPRHIAPLPCRGPAAEASLAEDCSPSSRRAFSRSQSGGSSTGLFGVSGGLGGRGGGERDLTGKPRRQRGGLGEAHSAVGLSNCDGSTGKRHASRSSQKGATYQYVPTALRFRKAQDAKPAYSRPRSDGF